MKDIKVSIPPTVKLADLAELAKANGCKLVHRNGEIRMERAK